jgi:hypothetical protein
MNISLKDVDRFMAKLDKSGDCWLYRPGSSVYGMFFYVDKEEGTRHRIGAHRFSYILHFGLIPDGMYVLHQCDTPRCCNPSHLSLGTPKENFIDMVEKERHSFFLSSVQRKARKKMLMDSMELRRRLRKKFKTNDL